MNYFFKNIIIGAGNLQLFPVSHGYDEKIKTIVKMAQKKAVQENLSPEIALDNCFQQRYIGLFFMFFFIVSCLASTIFLAAKNYDWTLTILPIALVWIVYPSIIFLKNKIIKEEMMDF